MRTEDLGRLLLLSALWGGLFPFMRIAAPVLGPIVVAEFRVLIGLPSGKKVRAQETDGISQSHFL